MGFWFQRPVGCWEMVIRSGVSRRPLYFALAAKQQ